MEASQTLPQISLRNFGRTDEISGRIYNSYMSTLAEVKEWKGVADEPYYLARRLSERFGGAI